MLQSYFVNMKMTRSDSVVTGFLLLLRCFLLTISLTSDVHGHTLRSRDDAVPSQIIRHRKLLVPSKGSRLIDGQYIIVLNKDVKSVEAKVEEVLGTSQSSSSSVYSKSVNSDIAEVNSFNSSISGFTITNVSQDCLQILLEDKDVKWIEQVSRRMQQGAMMIRFHSGRYTILHSTALMCRL